MPDTTNELDELLNKTFAYGVDWTEYKDKSEQDHDTSMFAAKIKAQQKEALKQELLVLITREKNKANEQGFYAGCGISGVELYAVPELYKKYRDALEKYSAVPVDSIKKRIV